MKIKHLIFNKENILQFVRKHRVVIIIICAIYGVWLYKGYYICTWNKWGFDIGYKFSKSKWGKIERENRYLYWIAEKNTATANTRRYMLCDLLSNCIEKGMSKQEVIEILGDDSLESGTSAYPPVPLWGNLTSHNYTKEDLKAFLFRDNAIHRSSKVIRITNYLNYRVGDTFDGTASLLFIFDSNNIIIDYVYTYSG